MQDYLFIDRLEQVATLFNPPRLELLKLLSRPRTCTQLARTVGQSPQRVYYQVKRLEHAGLVEKVDQRRVRGLTEGVYQAKARAYWISSRLVGQLGGRRVLPDPHSLAYMLSLTQEVYADVERLVFRPGETPSLALSTQVEFHDPNERQAFIDELQSAFEAIAGKYQRRTPSPDGDQDYAAEQPGEVIRLVLTAFPKP